MHNKTKLAAVLLLSVHALLFSMEDSESHVVAYDPAKHYYHGTSFKEMEDVLVDTPPKTQHSEKCEVVSDPAKHYFHGTSFKEMEDVFEDAPPKAKNLVAYLKDPSLFKRNGFGNAAFLIGNPGVGKTTLAKAIAYKAGWDCEFMTSTEVQGTYRNETASRLKDRLTEIVSRDVVTVAIIDEINRLLEHYGSKHHDTDMTSTELWTFLDQQRNNPKFFLIGTMNRADKIPQQIKSRVRTQWIHLLPLTDPAIKRKKFLSKLVDDTTALHRECNPEFLDRHLRRLDVGRDFEALASSACEIFRREDKRSPFKEIRKKHLLQALKEMKEMDQLVKYGEKEETDEERQERHHKESLELQERHLALQEKHFVQQQLMNLTTSLKQKNISNGVSVGISSNITQSTMSQDDILDLFSHLSPEQLKIFLKIKEDKEKSKQLLKEKEANSSCCVM